MKEAIKELGSLCKKAAELERKWDKAGGEYLGTRMKAVEYAEIVKEYLGSVRLLEFALKNHLAAITDEVAQAREVLRPERDDQDQRVS